MQIKGSQWKSTSGCVLLTHHIKRVQMILCTFASIHIVKLFIRKSDKSVNFEIKADEAQ